MDWYFVLLIIFCALAILYTLFAYVVSRKVLESAVHPQKHNFDEARAFQTSQEDLNFADYDSWHKEDFSVTSFDGTKIDGTLIFAENTQKVAVICHGFSWNRLTSVKYAQIYRSLGYNVVIYDHRYFGTSGGDFTTVGQKEKYDLSSVLDFVRKRFGTGATVGLHGESLGAVTTLGVLSLRSDVDFVVADCGFSKTFPYYNELCKHKTHLMGFPIVNFANARSKRLYGYDFRKANPIDAVAETNVPICFIHGTADKFILPHHSTDMFKVCKNAQSELHLVDGATHARSYLKNHAEYQTVVSAFVTKIENSKGEIQQ